MAKNLMKDRYPLFSILYPRFKNYGSRLGFESGTTIDDGVGSRRLGGCARSRTVISPAAFGPHFAAGHGRCVFSVVCGYLLLAAPTHYRGFLSHGVVSA